LDRVRLQLPESIKESLSNESISEAGVTGAEVAGSVVTGAGESVLLSSLAPLLLPVMRATARHKQNSLQEFMLNKEYN